MEAHDPADTWLFRPLRRVREVLAFRADRMQYLTIRRTLAVIFTVLVLFLAAIAWLEAS